jgi:hypothetical protein
VPTRARVAARRCTVAAIIGMAEVEDTCDTEKKSCDAKSDMGDINGINFVAQCHIRDK